jgi:hypothetical protein
MGLVEQVIIDKLIADWYELQQQNATDVATAKERHLSRNSESMAKPDDQQQQQQQQGSPQPRKSQSQLQRQSQQRKRKSSSAQRSSHRPHSGSPFSKPEKGAIKQHKAEIDEHKDSSIDYHKH